jgi:hypothetical protein
MHNYVLKKKKEKKKRRPQNTVLAPTRRQKPTHKSPTAAGMREYNRSILDKKTQHKPTKQKHLRSKHVRLPNKKNSSRLAARIFF